MRLFLPAALFAATLPCQTVPTAAPVPPSVPPAAATKTFRSDALHLSYAYPADLQTADTLAKLMLEGQQNAAPPEIKRILACVTVPFSAISVGGSPTFVVLLHADSACLHLDPGPQELARVSNAVVAALKAGAHGAQVTEPRPFEMGGLNASLIAGTVSLSPTPEPLRLALACAIHQSDLVCWQFVTSSEETMLSLAAGTEQFDGAPWSVIIPPALLSKQ